MLLVMLFRVVRQWLEHHLTHHLFYEQRKDRKNYFGLFAPVNARLG
jgi:hypothetical protein